MSGSRTVGVASDSGKGLPARRAVLDPLGCYVAVSMPAGDGVLIDRLELTFRAMAEAVDPVTRRAGREWIRFLADVRASAADVREIRAAGGSVDGSGAGTTEPVGGAGRPGLESPPRFRLTVDQVASRLRVSSRYVRKLCGDECLEATKAGGKWQIDPRSVEEFEATRRRS